MNVENLTILANYLDTLEPKKFDMGVYCQDEHGDSLNIYTHECGTVACAAGSGPAAGLPIDFTVDKGWDSYTHRVFGLDHLDVDWAWCFSGFWERLDNTPAGAAARIRHLLNGGEIYDPAVRL
ncbi:hypothetical protein [Rhizobium arsenicireducens]